MGLALTIPDVVESEDLHSVHREADGVTFEITLDVGRTSAALMHAAQSGLLYPLVVLTTDGGIIALDDVYVVSTNVGTSDQVVVAELQAREVRFV